LTSKANAALGAGGRVKVSIRRPGGTKLDKIVGLVMSAVGFCAALAVGYAALPALLYKTEEQPLQFDHAVHTGEKGGMACEDCHVFREDGTFAGIPSTKSCANCHENAIGSSPAEKLLVEKYIKSGAEIPWLVYSRQPDNAYFPHAPHVKAAKMPCSQCHGEHGKTDRLRPYSENRLTGYSRDIWGAQIAGIKTNSWDRMKMDDCVDCHAERGVEDSCMMCHK
jgi:hypothetical protein